MALAVLLAGPALAADPSATRGLAPQTGPASPARAGVYGKVHLLVVGVGDYRGDSGVRPLDHATADARGFRDALRRHVDVATTVERYDTDATRAGVFAALAELRETVTEGDALVVFWAGHGVSREGPSGVPLDYFVTHDGGASPHAPGNIAMGELRDQLDSIPAHHTLLIVDACFAGVLARRAAGGAERRRPDPSIYTRDPVFVVITAGAEGQVVLDGGPGGHSAFTGALIDALEGIEGYLTASELHLTVRDRVTTLAEAAGVEQTPLYARIDTAPDPRARPSDFVFVASERVRLRSALTAAKAAWEAARARCDAEAGAGLDRAMAAVQAADLSLADRVWAMEGAAQAAARACPAE